MVPDHLDCVFFGTPFKKLKYDRMPDMGVFQENIDYQYLFIVSGLKKTSETKAKADSWKCVNFEGFGTLSFRIMQ